MEESIQIKQINNKIADVKTFPVPFDLEELKEAIIITNIIETNHSKEKLINQAFKFHSEGNISEAAKYYKYYIDQGFNDHIVFSNYGLILKELGNVEQAELYARKAIEINPIFADGYYNLGIVLSNLGKLKEAELNTRKAIQINPKFADAYSNLGNILSNLCKLKEAELNTRKAIKLNPNFAEAYSNLGIILSNLGKLKEAELNTRKAIKLKPNFADAYYNLGIVLSNLGKLKEAELNTRKAIKLNSNFAEAHSSLGSILRDLRKLQDAELSTRKAIELNPNLTQAQSNLGTILRDLGKEKEAIRHYSLALETQPNNIYFYINSKFNFSKIMKDDSQIIKERINFQKQINLLKDKKKISYKDDEVFSTNIFYLPYHNRSDDKKILEELSKTLSNIKGVVNKDFSVDRKINANSKKNHLKVGICSEFLRSTHVVGKLYIKVMIDLLKTDLEITIYIPPGFKQFSENEILEKSFKRVVYLPKSPINAHKEIIKDKLDIMFYPDIGMSNYTYILALSRLALVQVNSLGHTNTSGIKTMDYFITSCVEPSTSNKEYTEKLVRFGRLPFNYIKPILNEKRIKNKNIINSDKHFNIGLTQTLFKLHPNYDNILVKILKEIPQGRLILIKDINNSVTEALKKRWAKNNNILLDRSIFLDMMPNNDFLNIIRNCDIMLDPLYYGSGNTFYESMAFGTPFITYKNQKSKIPIAGYEQMKISNPPIASSESDYINWCKIYYKDKSLLTNSRKEFIEKSNQYLFNDSDIYKQYYNFFNKATESAKKGEVIRTDWSP